MERNLRFRVPKMFQKLVQNYKQRFYQWAYDHTDWTPDQWKVCLLADETRICLQNVQTLRCCDEANVTYEVGYGGGSISIWVGISDFQSQPLVIFGNNSMNSLQHIGMPLAQKIGQEFTYVDDNAPPQ